MSRPSHHPWFNRHNNIGGKITNCETSHYAIFFRSSLCFIPLVSLSLFFKHLQPIFFPKGTRKSVHRQRRTSKIVVLYWTASLNDLRFTSLPWDIPSFLCLPVADYSAGKIVHSACVWTALETNKFLCWWGMPPAIQCLTTWPTLC